MVDQIVNLAVVILTLIFLLFISYLLYGKYGLAEALAFFVIAGALFDIKATIARNNPRG